MSNVAVLSPKRIERAPAAMAVPAAVFIMSLSSLLLELALTRLFSVILFYHFAFLAISIALLGLGAGGVFAYLKKLWLARWTIRQIGTAAALCNAGAILISLIIVLHTPVELHLSFKTFLRLTEIYLVSALPFFGTGLMFSVVFARETSRITSLYGADLVGGSAACLIIVPVLDFIGGPNAVLTSALLMGVAACVWADSKRARRVGVAASVALILLIAANYSGRILDVVYVKGHRQQKAEFMRWNAISRVEVDRFDTARVIVIDADASTYIMGLDPKNWEGSDYQKYMMASPPAVVNVLRPHGDYAIIGPGGGVDVLRAVANGSPSVTGIEINPLIANTVMRNLYADYSHHLYDLPQVHMHVSDGRSWVRGAKQQFDVLQMTLVDTWASTAAGAFALSENNLYTVNAFQEYFQHLKSDGMVAITRWEFARPREALRVVSVAIEALHRQGVANAREHFIVVSEGALNADGIPVLVLAKKTPFTAAEQERVRQHVASTPKLHIVYMPSAPGESAFQRLIDSNDPHQFSRNYEFNVKPVDDNAPFFFFTFKLADLIHHTSDHGIDYKVNAGVTVLMMVFVISIVAVAAFLILPLWRATSRPNPKPLFYFVAVGLGYILVEITFIQRFVLFLGHPTYALTVVVFLMLLFSGFGSIVSRKWLGESLRVNIPLALIVAAIALALVGLPPLLAALVKLPFFVKLVLSGMMLAPLGFLMGMPFPSGLRALSNAGEDTLEWAWALNAGASVLGSVLAMVVAIETSLNVTLTAGAVFYAIALLLTREFSTSRSTVPAMTDVA